MHSMLITDSGLALMASDTPNRMDYTPGNDYSVSSAAMMTLNCAATGTNFPRKALCPCRSSWRRGATPLACVPINSASAGW